jgi:hypothetical protein
MHGAFLPYDDARKIIRDRRVTPRRKKSERAAKSALHGQLFLDLDSSFRDSHWRRIRWVMKVNRVFLQRLGQKMLNRLPDFAPI